jgi:8-oxo-dGTP diphosphatase
MGKRNAIELIVRGVCALDGQLLVCRSPAAGHVYLPGGHIEFGEGAETALRREMEEELGLRAETGRFLGAVEHTFVDAGRRYCEINLVFVMRLEGLRAGRTPEAAEAALRFAWCPLDALPDIPLEPAPLRTRIPDWLRRGGGWASTYAS